MNEVDALHEFRKVAGRVGGHVVRRAHWGESVVESSNNLARAVGQIASVKDVKSRGLLKSPASRAFDLQRALWRGFACHQYGEVYVDESKKTVSLDQNARSLNASERELYSTFDLII